MEIEETIYQESLPVNSIAVLNRLKELLEKYETNNIGDIACYIEVAECMWLLNHQYRGFTAESHNEWLYLKEIREEQKMRRMENE